MCTDLVLPCTIAVASVTVPTASTASLSRPTCIVECTKPIPRVRLLPCAAPCIEIATTTSRVGRVIEGVLPSIA